MALFTIPSITKGTAVSVTLNKTELFELAAVVADAHFSDSDNVKRCVVEYNSDPSSQRKVLDFDLSQTTPSASLLISVKGRDTFLLERLVLEDFDGDILILERSELPSGLDIAIGGGNGGGGSVIDAQTVFLLNFENTSIDSAKGLIAAEFNGPIVYETGKFGQAFNSNTGVLKYTIGNDFVFGSESWCIEAHLKRSGAVTNAYWFKSSATTASFYIGWAGSNFDFYANLEGYEGAYKIGGNITVDALESAQWHHVALTFDSTTRQLRVFWDGVKRYEKTIVAGRTFGGNGSGLYTTESTHPIFIGAYDESGLYQARHLIDNLRISKGAARYTDAFTPPTSPVS